MRLLIAVVATRARLTLRGVLERIPEAFVRDVEIEILVIDDASPDGTFEEGLYWADEQAPRSVTVLRNPRPHGYGGNLKLAFEYAIEKGFDAIALLHGDGKYAPEVLPAMLEPIASGTADAVLGSRFLAAGEARRGDMPLYRRLANRLLTRVQNRLVGQGFSDFHSGYRVYSTAALRRIPFRYNSDDLHFDTDLLLQLVRGSFRIAEVPIPTYYGDNIGYSRGLEYVWNSLASTFAAVFDSVGIKYRRRFDVEGGPPAYSVKLGYSSSHTFAIEAVPPGSRVVDVGCGPGYVAKELLGKDCHVVGADHRPPSDAKNLSRFVTWRLDRDEPPLRLADYDFLLLLDVLEHLLEPERFMERLRQSFKLTQPTVILTVPNTAFLPIRVMLLLGQFNYGKEGILDFTHTRLFTFGSLQDALRQVGYEILEVRGVPAPFPKALGVSGLSHALVKLNELAIRLSKTLFSYQVFVRLRPLPTVDNLLEATVKHSAERRAEYRRSG